MRTLLEAAAAVHRSACHGARPAGCSPELRHVLGASRVRSKDFDRACQYSLLRRSERRGAAIASWTAPALTETRAPPDQLPFPFLRPE